MLKVSTVTYKKKILLESSEVPIPKCVKNEIRDFEMTTAPYLTKSPRHDNIYKLCLWMQEEHISLKLKS